MKFDALIAQLSTNMIQIWNQKKPDHRAAVTMIRNAGRSLLLLPPYSKRFH